MALGRIVGDCFQLASTVRGETERASTAADGTRAYYLASGSIDRAILWIFWGMQGFTIPMGRLDFIRLPCRALRSSTLPEPQWWK